MLMRGTSLSERVVRKKHIRTAGSVIFAHGAPIGPSAWTLYRWWHSKTELLLDALAERGQQTIPIPDTGALPDDLRAFLRATVDSADATTVRLLHQLAAAAASDETVAHKIRDQFLATRRAALGQILQRGAARGEITSANAALGVDLIYGSMWYRLIFLVGPLDYTWADQVATVFAPHRPATRGGSRDDHQHPSTGSRSPSATPNDQPGAD